mmetsp:Transcript_36005/g.81982  ORF Transcript_36005/g.81982 Transcript_36005/m.81982 type:complete len:293 (-) Transcript_36005:24-902(-)
MKRVLITGANKGIGLATAAKILETPDTYVFLGARDRSRGEEAMASLLQKSASWKDRVEVLEIDVSDDSSVIKAAAQVEAKFGKAPPPLYGIVNNAGIGLPEGDLRTVLQVNTYGPQRVCKAFVPLLNPDGGRVVNITSASGPTFVAKCSESRQQFFTSPDVTWDQIDALAQECLAIGSKEEFEAKGLADGSPYGLSKALGNCLTVFLAKQHPNLRVNACTPGFIETDLVRPFLTQTGKTAAEMGMKPPEAGTVAPMFLLMGEPEGNGRYYGSDAVRSPLDKYRGPGDPPYNP